MSKDEVVAQYQTSRLRGILWTSYKRIFQLTTDSVFTLDPSTFEKTNVFPFSGIVKLAPDDKKLDEFTFDCAGKDYRFKSSHRSLLLCDLFYSISKCCSKPAAYPPIPCYRLRKNGSRVAEMLELHSFGIVETDSKGIILQEYRFVNVSSYGYDEKAKAVYFEHSNGIKIYYISLSTCASVINGIKTLVKQLGMEDSISAMGCKNIEEIIASKQLITRNLGPSVAKFDVNKYSQRYRRSMCRVLVVTEGFIVEKDGSGFELISYVNLQNIYAIVRSWSNSREFTLEYKDGRSRTYTCAARDALISLLLDILRSMDIKNVAITGEISDRLRLMPRFAEEEYHSSVRDAFFGATSIEMWYLNALVKHCKTVPMTASLVVQACKEVNSNVPYSGISLNCDAGTVRNSLLGVLRCANFFLNESYKDNMTDNSRSLCVLLETIVRLVSSDNGYKQFVSIKEIDTRVLIMKLLGFDSDFVNYFTLEILNILFGVLPVRNMQQEFVNKHTLLTDAVLNQLMVTLGESSADIKETGTKQSVAPNSLVVVSASALLECVVSSSRDTSSPELVFRVLDVIADHFNVLIHMLRTNSFLILENTAIVMFVLLKNRQDIQNQLKETALSGGLALKHFYNGCFSPSSALRFISRFLVATWMSGNEHSSPGKSLLTRLVPPGMLAYLKFDPINDEQRKALDSIEEEFFLSESNSINAISLDGLDRQAKVRSRIASAMRDAVLDRTSVSNHKSKHSSPFKSPPHSPLKDRKEEDPSSGIKPKYSPRKSDVMAHVLGDDNRNSVLAKSRPENFRVFFHMITRSHNLPDLIWNDQTRSELRSILEMEINLFEKELLLYGFDGVAWNFRQFVVVYSSLKDELTVGNIYIQHFLSASSEVTRNLSNPSLLFEKLLRRVLMCADSDSALSILCLRCAIKLYSDARDIIGHFDDIQVVFRLLQDCERRETVHYCLEFLELLTLDVQNISHLLKEEFILLMTKFASLVFMKGNEFSMSLKSESGDAKILLENGGCKVVDSCVAVLYLARPGSKIPPSERSGPFSFEEIINKFKNKEINADWLMSSAINNADDYENSMYQLLDTGKWIKLSENFQFRNEVILDGNAVFTRNELAVKSLTILYRVANVHSTLDERGIRFYPPPVSRQIVAKGDNLQYFVQLLLSKDDKIVEISSELIRSLIDNNSLAISKLYRSGCFYFSLLCEGDILPIATFLEYTHLKQSCVGISIIENTITCKNSILYGILPDGLINILINYGAEQFASVFTGDYDSPEVIWNNTMRQHLRKSILQHLGNFVSLLSEDINTVYQFSPIPSITYPLFECEIFVFEYYLRNLTDESRYAEWPIGEPLKLLRDTIDRWRNDYKKSDDEAGIEEAISILELSAGFSEGDLRKAYKRLARLNHPDRNPNAGDLFLKIHAAYELLIHRNVKYIANSKHNSLLLLKTQIIVYRRFVSEIKDQIYPAYDLLLTLFDDIIGGVTTATGLEESNCKVIDSVVELLYFTCLNSSNCTEFIELGGIGKVLKLLKLFDVFPLTDQHQAIVCKSLKILVCTANLNAGLEILIQCDDFDRYIFNILQFGDSMASVVEQAMELVFHCCKSVELQNKFVSCNVQWRCFPYLLQFEGIFEADEDDNVTRHLSSVQISRNLLSSCAAKALGRLGGYMLGGFETSSNPALQRALGTLLTPSLSKLLRNQNSKELLGCLNQNVESPTKIWNDGMKSELLLFQSKFDLSMSSDEIFSIIQSFEFSCTRNELYISGVYVRVFNKMHEVADIENPSLFAKDLITFIMESKVGETVSEALLSLTLLIPMFSYIPTEISENGKFVSRLIELLDCTGLCELAEKIISSLCNIPEFLNSLDANKSNFSNLLRLLCLSKGLSTIWTSMEVISMSSIGFGNMMQVGFVSRMVGVMCGLERFNADFKNRLSATSLMIKLLWNTGKGTEACAELRRLLPEPLVINMTTTTSATEILKIFDSNVETPELIWSQDMRDELKSSLQVLLYNSNCASEEVVVNSFDAVPDIPRFYLKYSRLDKELYIGGIYIRLFMKTPGVKVLNPVYFLEKVVEFWENSFEMQFPGASQKFSSNDKSIVLGNEDFMTLLTSCIICVVRSYPTILQQLLLWEFPARLVTLLKKSVDFGLYGSPATSCLRICKLVAESVEIIDQFALFPADIVLQLVRYLDVNEWISKQIVGISGMTDSPELRTDSVIALEILKALFESNTRYQDALVSAAMRSNLITFLVENVLQMPAKCFAKIKNERYMRSITAEVVKAIIVADPVKTLALARWLDTVPVWVSFKAQQGDLLLTNGDRTDQYLLEDMTSESKFAGLITDGSLYNVFVDTERVFDRSSLAGNNPDVPKDNSAGKPNSMRINASLKPVTAMSPPISPVKQSQTVITGGGSPVGYDSTPVKSLSKSIVRFTVTIAKTEHGIGLDIAKTADGGTMVQKIKELPEGLLNPASLCSPGLLPGDVIVEVNGVMCDKFSNTVKCIRAAEGVVSLTIERSSG